MAIADNLVCQIYPVAGETAVKNIVSGALFAGTGTPTLVDEGAEKAWTLTTTTALDLAVATKVIDGSTPGSGATIAIRFKLNSATTADFMPIFGIKASAGLLADGLAFTRNGTTAYRGRCAATIAAGVSSKANGVIHTLVYKVEVSQPALDVGKIWFNTVGRVGTAADVTSTGANLGTPTFNTMSLGCSGGAVITILDAAYWSTEKTDAECAAIADDYRAVMPAPSGGTTPTGTVTIGTITKTSTTATIPYTYSAADQTGFEYRLNGGTPVADAASPVDLTGLTASTAYTIEVRAVNASGAGSWSAVASFTTDAGADTDPPTFTVAPAVTSISTTTATVTATINETGNIYHVIVPQADATPSVAQVKAGQNSAGGAPVESGSALATTTISDPVSGLTADTAYKMCMVAEDDELTPNIQAAVTTVNFTTSAVAVGTITLTDLVSIQDVAWASQSSITCDVINPSTGALVVRKTGLTSTAGADVVFSDAAIVAATTYDVVIRIGADKIGIARAIAT